MHIETLKTFCDLVETGSFSRAAQLNYVSQSAVSQQVKALESRYNCVLLERGQHRTTLTTAGRLLYGECRPLLERLRRVEERLRSGNGDRRAGQDRHGLQRRPARPAAVRSPGS